MRIVRAWPLVLAALVLSPGRAGAQFRSGRGFGFGYGYSPYYSSPGRPEPLLYQQALLNASRASMGPPTHGVYDGRPAAYLHHLRDPGYLDGMDVATRRRIEATIGRYSDGPPPPDRRGPPPAAAPAPAAPRANAAPAEAVPPAPRDPAPDPAGRAEPGRAGAGS